MLSKWIATVFFLLLLFNAFSQDKKLPLKTVLDSLEVRYNVLFSYADENIIDNEVLLPDQNLSLDDCLTKLSQQTQLSFEILSNRYIAIQVDSDYVICGYLLDSKSRDPIIAAIVSVSNTEKYTITDEYGFFTLSLSREHPQISISHISYHKHNLSIESRGKCDEILLDQNIEELKEVYISNYLVQGLNRKMNGAFTVSTKELQVLPGLSEPDVLYTMQILPGIQSPLESVSNINIRGGTNDQNLIRWDGIRMFQSAHFFGLISAFNPYFTESVSLTKNGSEASFGESVSGILDIHSGDDIIDRLSGGGGVNLLSTDMYLNVPVSKKLSIGFSARRSLADLVETPTYKKYFDRAFQNSSINQTGSGFSGEQNFTFYDLSAKVNYQLTKNDLINLSFIHVSNDLSYTEKSFNGSILTRESSLGQKNLGAGLHYTRTWNSRLKTNFNSSLSSYALAATNNNISDNQRLIQENEVLDIGAEASMELEISTSLNFEAGIQFEETGITNYEDVNNPAFTRRVKNVLKRYVSYAELNFLSESAKTNLHLGLRTNYYAEINRFIPEPRLSFRQEVTSNLSIELMGEFKSQTTMQVIDLQTDFLGVERRRWVLTNGQDIPLLQSKQISTGLQYVKNKLLVSGEAYFKYVDGIITSSQGFQNQYELIRSAGSYQILGFDFLVNKKFEKYSFWASYSLSKNNYLFKGLMDTAFPNNLDVRHSVSAGASYKYEHFQFSSGINWFTGLPFTPLNYSDPILTGSLNYAIPNSERISPYSRMDVSVKYLFSLGENINAQIGFSIWNLTNRTNTLRKYFMLDTEGKIQNLVQYGLDFTPNAMFRVSF